MPLTRAQRKPFAEAMLKAFPTRGDLRRMAGYGLDLNLDEIAGDNLDDLVFNLLIWADKTGRGDDLVKAACDNSPGNAALQVFCTGDAAPAAPSLSAAPAPEEAQRRQALLDGYLDQMQQLLLTTPLHTGVDDARSKIALEMARTRTVRLLPQLDAGQKAAVLQFLYRAELITGERMLVDLRGADLTGADLHKTILYEAKLSTVRLKGADLSGAYLNGANLIEADLTQADLTGAHLNYLILEIEDDMRDLSGANLYRANLTEANLREADLSGANLFQANLSGTNLQEADLRGANLRGADLHGADLSGANLTDAFVRAGELLVVRALEGTTLPNGRQYTGPNPPTSEADLGPRDPHNPDFLAR